MLCHHQIYSKLFRWSNVWLSRLSARCRFIGQKFRVWVTSIHHIYFPSSHLPLFVPPKGEDSSFIFRDSLDGAISVFVLYSLLCYSWEKWVKIREQSHYITYKYISSIATSQQKVFKHLDSQLSVAGHSRGKILRWREDEGRKQQVWKMSCRSD